MLIAGVLGISAVTVPPAFAGTVVLDPTSYNFGSQRVGTQDQANLVLTNTGTSTQVNGSTITGGASSFAASGCGSESPILLEAGESCVITVTFAPASVGAKTATLTVQQDGGASAAAALMGTGVAPMAELSTEAFDFGAVELGTSSAAKTVTLTNTGSGDLQVGDVEFGGDNGEFVSDGGCAGDVVPPEGTCQIEVTFTPVVVGSRAATMTVNSDGGIPTVEFDGAGADTIAPTVTLSDPTVPFTLASSTVLHFDGADNVGGSSVASFQVRRKTAPWNGSFGAWEYPASWSTIVANSLNVALSASKTTCFAARSRDVAGNPSPWSATRCTARPLDDRSLAASSGWTRVTGSAFYLGTATRSSQKGAVLTRTSVRASRLALVATTCQTCGTVGVYIGSTLVAKVSLTRATTTNRALIVLPAFSLRSGTVTIKVLTSQKLVRIDGLGVYRSW